uniref:Calcineurin-like phosphoesterase domain-containing protein n=1 Tax=Lotharella globosa TaxID=91324 RepID=A0A7S4DXD0_9EUKA
MARGLAGATRYRSSLARQLKQNLSKMRYKKLLNGRSVGLVLAGLGLAGGASIAEEEESQRASSEEPLFRFGVIADVQYADIDNATSFGGGEYRFYRGTLDSLAKSIDWWNLHYPDIQFIANLGDLIDGQNAGGYGAGLNFSEPQSAVALERVVSQFRRSLCPTVHHAIGNHELYNFDREQLHSHLFKDKTPPLSEAPGATPSQLYYSFRPHPQWRFLLIDCYDIAVQGREEGSEQMAKARQLIAENNPNVFAGKNWFEGVHPSKHRFVPYNGAVGSSQLEWLRAQLSEAKKGGERCVVMTHVPLDPRASSPKTVVWNYPDVMSVIRESECVALVLAGHHHPGGYVQDEGGCHHLTIEGSLTHENGAFGVFEVHEDHLKLVGKGDLPSRKLELR